MDYPAVAQLDAALRTVDVVVARPSHGYVTTGANVEFVLLSETLIDGEGSVIGQGKDGRTFRYQLVASLCQLCDFRSH
jgi:hypothetical protein